MSYQYTYNTTDLYWVHYIGTSNGAFIRANNHNSAKWIFARGEGLSSVCYLKSTTKHPQV